MSGKPAVEISVGGVRSALDLDGKAVVVVRYRGQPAIPAHTVGEVLGYAEHGKTLAKVIRKDWADEFQPGVHLDVLRGEELAEFKRDAESVVSPSTRALTVLYPKGVALLAAKSGKPAGQRLAALLGGVEPLVEGTAAPERLSEAACQAPWWWADAHRYIDRCVAAGLMSEREGLAKLAPLYARAIGLR